MLHTVTIRFPLCRCSNKGRVLRRDSGMQLMQRLEKTDFRTLQPLHEDAANALRDDLDAQELVADIYDAYHRQLGESLDFDDQLHFGLALVRDKPEVCGGLEGSGVHISSLLYILMRLEEPGKCVVATTCSTNCKQQHRKPKGSSVEG